MSGNDKRELVKKARALMADERLSEELCATIEEQRGSLGFLLSTLRERPRTFNAFLLKGESIYREPSAIDRKTAELAAVAAAAALSCEHCLEAHINRAVDEGATLEEVMDVLLVAGAIAESSLLSVAFRKFRQKEGKMKRKGQEAAGRTGEAS
ncbi:MAG: carboxymuconolactone decarboxylase family protein [Alphaproteobacteria bacterium]|uniref:Carboxymuconolactone decarboxylase family protein n=1 Tax=Candidatus Nitrobium versatile TaxID=2884831 RepID=A0A953M193_9BACT|nr:carboxymuconolactone decarboxylase family protein [Candidatus Nitrobium versatile]